jgi:hypothetical protein
MATTMRRSLIAFWFVAACSGGEDSSIVATWREVPNAFTVPEDQELMVWTFAEDGSYERVENGDTERGFYELADGFLLLREEEEGDPAFEATYLLDGDHLLWAAMLPVDEVVGAVGTWEGTVALAGSRYTITYQLRDDGTGSVAYDREVGEDQTLDGTWEEDGTSFRFTHEPEENVTVDLLGHRLDELALGSMLERLDP